MRSGDRRSGSLKPQITGVSSIFMPKKTRIQTSSPVGLLQLLCKLRRQSRNGTIEGTDSCSTSARVAGLCHPPGVNSATSQPASKIMSEGAVETPSQIQWLPGRNPPNSSAAPPATNWFASATKTSPSAATAAAKSTSASGPPASTRSALPSSTLKF
jgi:hypothetical protein